eukprot:241304_1
MGALNSLVCTYQSRFETARHDPRSANYLVPPRHESISSAICNYISRESNVEVPKDIIGICRLYVGYIFVSSILNDFEKITLYHLLREHHTKYKIGSPLMDTTYIRYFSLIFRYRAMNGIKLDCHSLLVQFANRENLLMVFHTGYDHVFCFFFRNKFIMHDPAPIYYGPHQNTADHFAMFLLRSQFVDDRCGKCPRRIDLKDGIKINKVGFDSNYDVNRPYNSSFSVANICINNPDHFMTTTNIEATGNEICGAKDGCFDPTANGLYWFPLDGFELFQIV